jgi:hypothetical protein
VRSLSAPTPTSLSEALWHHPARLHERHARVGFPSPPPTPPHRWRAPLHKPATGDPAQNERGCHQRQCSYSTQVFRHL